MAHLIFSFRTQCCLLDVFTGTEVVPPHIPSTHGCDLTYGTLLAPLASSKSHLLVNNRSCLFLWHVGIDSWSDHPLDDVDIIQIVVLKGEIFAMDDLRRLFTIRLVPQLCIEELTIVCEKDMLESFFFQLWLVVCGDMLLSVSYSFVASAPVGTATYEVFRLDVSNQPTKWVKVEKLEIWALFVSNDRRSSAFACMSPERWGGQSNCVYHAHATGSWTATPLDQHHGYVDLAHEYMYHMAPLWMLPSTLLLANGHPM